MSFKCLRLLRVLKLLRNWKALNSLLKKILKSMKDASYFSILVLLFAYICSLLGMELFAFKCFFNDQEELVKGEELENMLLL